MPRVAPILSALLLVVLPVILPAVLLVTPAAAQTLNNYNINAASQERISENHWKLSGNVELEQKDTKLYADEVEWFTDENRAIATGNVVFTQGNNRIAADRAEFNTQTRLGTFYSASGIANVQPPRQRSTGMGMGGFAPPLSNQQTDVYFFGDVVEKIGPKKYKISNGGFSTCVQPTPRWDMHADTVVLNIDHYTLLRNAVLNVKGVPMLYLPVLYYPTKEDGRATGILIPTWGMDSIRGQAIHNAFFWAINRSQDATILHDWYSKAGQGVGGEYRYNFGGGSDGTLTTHLLNQNATTGTNGAGLPKARSYQLTGFANQMLPGRLRARFSADYFSSLAVNQSFSTDVYAASRNSRAFGGNVVGAWRNFSLNGTYNRREYFQSTSSSWVQGSSPQIVLSKNEKPLFKNAPIYYSATSEFQRIERQTRTEGVASDDSGVTRIDVMPQVRYPFKKWQWFTVNSSFMWRDTYYTRSNTLAANGIDRGPIIEDNLNRRYYEVSANTTGPVFNRIFNTPDSGFAERWKHTVEPFFNIQRRSAVDAFNRVIQNDATDSIIGNTTNLTYGINNRLYAKRRSEPGRPSMAQELLSLEVVQTYYSSAAASQYDTRFQTSFVLGGQPSNFSPLQVSLRATPATALNASLRAEIDSKYKALRTIGANTNINAGSRLQTQVGWTKRFYIPELIGFNDRANLDHMLNTQANVHTTDNRIGVVHSLNYDIQRNGIVQQSISAFYNAQCCGLSFQYQTYNYAGLGSLYPPVRRFFLSFTLAGLGNFSPFNGAMSGMPR